MGYNPDNECPVCKSAYSDNYEGFIWTCRGCGNRFDNELQEWQEKAPQNLPEADAYSLLAEVVPIEQWGDETGLKKELDTHLEYGDDFVRLALISFRQYLRDNFS